MPAEVEQDLPGGARPNSGTPEQLRAALAALLKQYPQEQLWAAQAASQWPGGSQGPAPPPTNDLMQRNPVPGDPGAFQSMPLANPPDRYLRFPLAGTPKPGADELFPGAQVEQAGPYELPKSPPKSAKKSKR